jgi:hypothetical protein
VKLPIAHFLLLTFALLFAGCASGPTFENKQQSDDASIRCEQVGFGDAMSGDSMVAVNEIDGAKTAFMKKGAIYYVRPGKHELELAFGRIVTMQVVHQYVQFEASANHKYVLRASKKDRDFVVDLVDETDPKATSIIATAKVKASLPNILPVPIPAK